MHIIYLPINWFRVEHTRAKSISFWTLV